MSKKLTRSYIHIPRTTPFSGKTLGQAFNETADRNPDKEMYVFYGDKERKTYRQMQQESQQFAGALLRLGLKKGDVLGVWGNNHCEWLIAYLGASQIGIITVHMRIDFPLDVQQKIIRKFGINVLVLVRSPPDLFDKVCNIIPELLSCSANNLVSKSLPSIKFVITAGSNKASGAFSLTEVMNIGKEVDNLTVMDACQNVDYDDILAVFFTSGSTGFPKGVTHTNKSLIEMFNLNRMQFDLEDADGNHIQWESRYAVIMSFGSVGAQFGVVTPIAIGNTVILVAPTYDKLILAKAIHDERVTGSLLMIDYLNDIVNLPNIDDYDFSSFILCVGGGSMIPLSMRDRAKKIAKHFVTWYGGTEGFAAFESLKDPIEIRSATAYHPAEGSEVKIIGDDGIILPINTPGEICFRNDTPFLYYWGDEEKTKAAKLPSGWYLTGDFGILDESGYLRIVGRTAERIIKGGIHIAPGNLEKVLDQHPDVNNVMVIGVPDARTSEEVCACVRLHPSAKVTEEELRDFCKGKVADFLVPKYVIFMEAAFPTVGSGKFDRRQIAENAKSILGL